MTFNPYALSAIILAWGAVTIAVYFVGYYMGRVSVHLQRAEQAAKDAR